MAVFLLCVKYVSLFRSLIQFFAITFGSSLFNVIIGFRKLSKTWNLQFTTKQLVCFMCIFTTQYLELIYIIIVVLNNQYIYIIATTFYTGPDWEKFNLFFKHQYQLDFTVATLVLMPVVFTFIYIWRLIYCLTSCVRTVGTWKTILFLKRSPSAFWTSIITNLAIYDLNLDKAEEDNLEDEKSLDFEDRVIQAITQKISPQPRRMSFEMKNAKPNMKIQRSQSLPIMLLTSSIGSPGTQKLSSYELVHCTSIVSLYTPYRPPLNIKKSINLFSLWAFSLTLVFILSVALDASRDDIFVSQIIFRLILVLINTLCYFYIIR